MAGEAYSKRYGSGGFVDLPAQTTSIDSQFLNGVEAALARLLGADPTDACVQVWDAGLGRFKTIKLTANNLDPAAAIAKSQLAPLAITDADVAAGANIAGTKIGGNIPASKLANYPGDVNKVLRGDGSFDVARGSICQVFRSANLPLANGSTTVIPWDSEQYDTDNYHSPSTNPSRLTVPTPGLYLATVALDVQTGTNAALDTLWFYQSGNARWSMRKHPEASATNWFFSIPMVLVANDYIEVAYLNSNTGSHTLSSAAYVSTFSLLRLGS